MEQIKININGVIVELGKEDVSKALEAGELQLTTDKVIVKEEGQVVYTAKEHETFTKNLADDEYHKGKEAGSEMIIKEGREKYNLQFEGKTIDNFVGALKSKFEVNAEKPNERITELESDNEALRNNLKTIEGDFNTYKNEEAAKATRTRKDNTLMSFIPNEGLIVDKEIALLAIKQKAGLDIDFSDTGGVIPTINGQVEKDQKTLEPKEAKIVVGEALSSLNLVAKPPSGNGNGDEPGDGAAAGSYERFMKEMTDKGATSEEISSEMLKRQKEKTLII